MSSPSPALVNQLRNQRQPSTTDSSSRNMAEHSRPNSRYSESKYTDPTRTSSSSFKPPMTKEAVSKSKTQQPKSDSGLFSALSYIKHMIVGKPTGDNSMKTLASDSQKNKTPTKENKPESKSEKPKEIEANQKAEEQTDFLPTDARSWGQLSPALTGMKSTDKISKKDKIMKPNKRPQSKREVVPLENDAPKFDLPHYTPVRFVENRSTYLHAPEKKGTTSFRITTCPKSNHIPMPTLLSPNMEHSRSPGRKSGNTKNKDMRYSRKQSTSPIRHEKESYQSRVRSKSTLDSPSPKARSTARRAVALTPPRAKSPASTRAMMKNNSPSNEFSYTVKNSDTQEDTKRVMASWPNYKSGKGNHQSLKEDKKEKKEGKVNFVVHPDVDNSTGQNANTSAGSDTKEGNFFSSLISSSSQDKDTKSQSPARKAFDSAMDVALGVLSNLTPPNKKEPSENKPSSSKLPHQGSPEPSTRKQQDTQDGSLSSTLAMISTFVQKKLSPDLHTYDGSDEEKTTTDDESVSKINSPNQFEYLRRKKNNIKPSKESSFLRSRQDESDSSSKKQLGESNTHRLRPMSHHGKY